MKKLEPKKPELTPEQRIGNLAAKAFDSGFLQAIEIGFHCAKTGSNLKSAIKYGREIIARSNKRLKAVS